MSRKSIDSAPKSPTSVACDLMSSSSTPKASVRQEFDFLKYFVLCSEHVPLLPRHETYYC